MSNSIYKYRASELILKQLRGEISHGEHEELEAWKANNPSYQALVKELTDDAMLVENITEFEGLGERINAKLYSVIPNATPVVIFYKRPFFRVAAAAAIIIMLGLSGYLIFFNKVQKQPELVKVEPTKDVEAPKAVKALITLADGRTISIDSLTTINQSSVQLTKTADGKIIYSGPSTSSGSNELVFNTLTNPRGSRVIDMQLADGSHIWLNAGSSITYPIAFTGSERKVSITGEAYFNVAHNSSMPFTVNKGDVNVTVLGTEFNVNAYDDEADIKVTLLKGSVKVKSGNESSLLTPGQQAQISGSIKVISNINTDEVVAWLNGLFSFTRADIKTIMRQLARWYDLEVTYEGVIAQREFSGEMQRDLPLSGMIRLLEKGKVHLKLEGKQLKVLP